MAGRRMIAVAAVCDMVTRPFDLPIWHFANERDRRYEGSPVRSLDIR